MEKLQTKHLIMESRLDETNAVAIEKDELQDAFYFIIGGTSRKVSNDDINYAFTEALAQWT